MNSDYLTVIVQVRAKPGKESQVHHALLSLVAPSREDPGCVNYDLHRALDNHALFLFHENWTSEAHLEQHLQKQDLKAVIAKLENMVVEPPQITLWKKIG